MPPPYTPPPTIRLSAKRRTGKHIAPSDPPDIIVLQALIAFVKLQNSRHNPCTIARVTMWLLDKTSDVDQLNRVYNLALACDAIRERDGNITTGDPKWRLGKNES